MKNQQIDMIRKSLITVFLVLLMGLPVVKLQAQSSVTAQVFAEVIPALTATELAELNFGKFSPETQGGSVLVTPDGVRSASGSVELSGGSHNPASFFITGEGGATYSIILPTQPAVLTNASNTKTMVVSNWISFPSAGIGNGLLAQGSQEVKVGATLHVGSMAENPVGVYTGTYSITFSYN